MIGDIMLFPVALPNRYPKINRLESDLEI